MVTVFLLSLYLSFAGMGLYSSMFGQIWPVAQLDFAIDGSFGVLISIGITGGTIVGSLIGARVQRKIGAGKTTFLAILFLGIVCFCISLVPSFWMFVLLSIPLGFMGGLLDVTINNYMAQNFKPQFMSWLHAVWGIGSFAAPNIAAHYLITGQWRPSYRVISMVQIAVSGLMFLMIPQWNKLKEGSSDKKMEISSVVKCSPFQIKGVTPLLIAVFFYGGAENAFNYWGSTYLVGYHNITPDIAARWMSLFFAGIMISRILSGFVAIWLDNKIIVNISQLIMIFGGSLLLLSFNNASLVAGIFLFGFGCGPVAPGKLQLAPERFGKHRAQEVIGIQTAFLFAGGMIVPPLTGMIGNNVSLLFLPIVLVFSSVILWLATNRINHLTKPA